MKNERQTKNFHLPKGSLKQKCPTLANGTLCMLLNFIDLIDCSS